VSDSDISAIARDAGLKQVGARPPLGSYLAETWRRRAFAMSLARYRLEASLHESRLGLGWIVLRPLLNAAIYGTVFGLIMDRSSRPGDIPFIPFLVVGVFVFEFFSKSFGSGAKAITGNAGLVRSLTFPRLLLPLSQIIQFIIELVPMLIVMAIIVAAFGVPITWTWLLVIPLMGLMTMFNFGVALIAARLTVHLRDVAQIIPLVTRLFFYGSGIFYSLDLVLADNPAWMLTVAHLNPVGGFIGLTRLFVLGGPEVSTLLWVATLVSPFVTMAFGVVFFWRAEEKYGRD